MYDDEKIIGSDAGSTDRPQGPSTSTESIAPALDKPIAKLKRALAAEDTEEACSAYEAVKAQANGTSPARLMRILDEALHHRAVKLLAKAHSHLHCYMCENGRLPCKDCDGDDPRCNACGGTAWVNCTFCHGTGWSDEDVIPLELRQAVLARRMKDLLRSIISYQNIWQRLITASGHVPANKREDMRRLGNQLSARAEWLAQDERIDHAQREALQQAGQKIDDLLMDLAAG